jgi:hypothetical protein
MKYAIFTLLFLYCSIGKTQESLPSSDLILKYSPVSILHVGTPAFQIGVEHFHTNLRSRQYEVGFFSGKLIPSLIHDESYYGFRFCFAIRKYKKPFSLTTTNKYKSIVFHNKQVYANVRFSHGIESSFFMTLPAVRNTFGASYEFGRSKVVGDKQNFHVEWGFSAGLALTHLIYDVQEAGGMLPFGWLPFNPLIPIPIPTAQVVFKVGFLTKPLEKNQSL